MTLLEDRQRALAVAGVGEVDLLLDQLDPLVDQRPHPDDIGELERIVGHQLFKAGEIGVVAFDEVPVGGEKGGIGQQQVAAIRRFGADQAGVDAADLFLDLKRVLDQPDVVLLAGGDPERANEHQREQGEACCSESD